MQKKQERSCFGELWQAFVLIRMFVSLLECNLVWYVSTDGLYSASLNLILLPLIPRTEGEHSQDVLKPYDWTYTTDYKGTLLGESLKLKVSLIFCFYDQVIVLDSVSIRTPQLWPIFAAAFIPLTFYRGKLQNLMWRDFAYWL